MGGIKEVNLQQPRSLPSSSTKIDISGVDLGGKLWASVTDSSDEDPNDDGCRILPELPVKDFRKVYVRRNKGITPNSKEDLEMVGSCNKQIDNWEGDFTKKLSERTEGKSRLKLRKPTDSVRIVCEALKKAEEDNFKNKIGTKEDRSVMQAGHRSEDVFEVGSKLGVFEEANQKDKIAHLDMLFMKEVRKTPKVKEMYEEDEECDVLNPTLAMIEKFLGIDCLEEE